MVSLAEHHQTGHSVNGCLEDANAILESPTRMVLGRRSRAQNRRWSRDSGDTQGKNRGVEAARRKPAIH
jgi:hypothetical protein